MPTSNQRWDSKADILVIILHHAYGITLADTVNGTLTRLSCGDDFRKVIFAPILKTDSPSTWSRRLKLTSGLLIALWTTWSPCCGRHFRCISVNENVCMLIQIPLKFVPKGPINNNAALVQAMAWRRRGDKPLPEPMLTQVTDAYMRH